MGLSKSLKALTYLNGKLNIEIVNNTLSRIITFNYTLNVISDIFVLLPSSLLNLVPQHSFGLSDPETY